MASRTHVMVITESAALERRTSSLLAAAGCTVVVPAHDESAIRAIERLRPHAVVLDCEHPAAVSDRLFELTDAHGIGVLVYGRDTREADADIIARQQNVCRLPQVGHGGGVSDAVHGAITMAAAYALPLAVSPRLTAP